MNLSKVLFVGVLERCPVAPMRAACERAYTGSLLRGFRPVGRPISKEIVLSAIERDAPVVNQLARRIPVMLSVLHALFFMAGLVVVPILAPAAKIPNPFGSDDVSRTFFLNNPGAVRVSDFLQLASAVSVWRLWVRPLAACISPAEVLRCRSSNFVGQYRRLPSACNLSFVLVGTGITGYQLTRARHSARCSSSRFSWEARDGQGSSPYS